MKIFQRIYHALFICKQSFSFLMRHKELMVLPVLSGLLIIVVCALFVALVIALKNTTILASGNDKWLDGTVGIIALFILFVINSFIATVMQVALTKQIVGFFEQRTVGMQQAVSASLSRTGTLFSWALISGLIALIMIKRKDSNIAERLIGSTIRLGWQAISFFVIPILALNNLGVTQTIKESALLFKNTFGESVVAIVGFGALRVAYFLLLVVLLVGLPNIFALKYLVLFGVLATVVLTFIGNIFISTAEAIFKTAVYEHTQGKTVGIFPQQYYSKSFVTPE